jgi:hypothetical protein
MKWLLVSTNPQPNIPKTNHPGGAGWNVGDVFARIGTEQAIRAVDPHAIFDVLNVDDHDDVMRERDFDRCVLAGRPLFWPNCETFPEWDHVLFPGWPGRDPRKIAALGVGSCYPIPRDDRHVAERLVELRRKVWDYSLRFRFGNENPSRPAVCPASWVLLGRPEKPHRKLCNFMRGGGHYPEFAPDEAIRWGRVEAIVAGELLDRGFEFIAHTEQEREKARTLGFPEDAIVFADSIEPYLDAYASASHYFGNRMHGAVVLAGRRARVFAVGFDSRLDMIESCELTGRPPSRVTLEDVRAFATSEIQPSDELRVGLITTEWLLARAMMRDFSKSTP